MKKIILFAIFALAAQCLYAQHVTKGEIEFFKNPQEVYVPTKANEKARVDNVILLIGDGMGMGHVSASMYVNGGQLTMTGMGGLRLGKDTVGFGFYHGFRCFCDCLCYRA